MGSHGLQSILPATATLVLILTGCSQDDIRTYSAPKEAPAAGAPAGEPMPATEATATETVRWELPKGWAERPGEGMRFATLLLEPESNPPLELRVTPLALAARDPLANINRWREQIGLGPIGPADLDRVARSVDIAGRTVHLVDMTGVAHANQPVRRILAAILPGDQQVWFFLVMDEPERIGQYAAAFEAFMRTVRVEHAVVASELPLGHPPLEAGGAGPATDPGSMAGASAPGDNPLHWTTPSGWVESQATNPSRLASMSVVDGAYRAEVTITRFPGAVGGMLANVNRWRGQIGLQPVADLAQQPIEGIEIDGVSAQLLEIHAAGAAQRLLIVLIPREDFTYFVKMTGDEALVAKQHSTFVQFARGIHFDHGAS